MAQLKVLAHGFTTQVEIAVLHAQVVAAVGVVLNRKGRHLRGVEYGKLTDDNLDVAGSYFGVLTGAFAHGAHNLNDVFASQFVGLMTKFGIVLLVKHELRNAIAVAQVYKRHTAHLADTLYPARQGDGRVDVADAEFAACFGSVHMNIVIMICRCYFSELRSNCEITTNL